MLPQTSLAPGAVVCLDTGTGGDFTCRVCEVTAASSDPTRCLVLTLRTTSPSQFKVQREKKETKTGKNETARCVDREATGLQGIHVFP